MEADKIKWRQTRLNAGRQDRSGPDRLPFRSFDAINRFLPPVKRLVVLRTRGASLSIWGNNFDGFVRVEDARVGRALTDAVDHRSLCRIIQGDNRGLKHNASITYSSTVNRRIEGPVLGQTARLRFKS